MARSEIQDLDLVALIVDLPSEQLYRGQVGTVVHVHTPDTFEVEFVDESGHTYGLTTLSADQLLLLHWEQVAA